MSGVTDSSDSPARRSVSADDSDRRDGPEERKGGQPACHRRTMLSAMAGGATLAAIPTGVSASGNTPDMPRATGYSSAISAVPSLVEAEEPATLEGRVTTVSTADGRVLVGTTRGVYAIRDGTLEAFVPTRTVRAVEPTGDGTAVVVTEDMFFQNVLLVDLVDGGRIWTAGRTTEIYNHERGTETRQVAAFDAAVLDESGKPDIVVATAYGIVRLAGDGATGGAENTAIQWEHELDVYAWRVAVVDDTVFASVQDGRVLALDVESGQTVWEADVATPYDGVQRSAWDIEPVEDRLAVTTEDGYVTLLDVGDGATVWDQQVLDLDEDYLERYYRDIDGRPTMPGGPGEAPDPHFFNVEVTAVADDGFAVTTREGRHVREHSVELHFVGANGTLEWTAEDVDLVDQRAVCYSPAVDENALFVLEPPARRGGPDAPDREIVRVDLESGSEDGRLKLPIAPGDGRDALVSEGERLVVAPETGGIEAIDTDGNYIWGFPAVEDGTVFRADFLGDGVADYLVYEPGDDESGAAALVVRSGADGTTAWTRALSVREQLEDGAFRDVRTVRRPAAGVDLVAVTQRPRTEADDEIEDLERKMSELEREITDLERRPEDHDEDIQQLRSEMEAVRAEIETLGGRREAHVVVLSGADGSERRRVPLRIPREGLDELIDPVSMDLFSHDLAIVAGNSAVYLVDLDAGEVFWERQYREEEFWPPVGERSVQYRTVTGPDDVDNLLAIDPRELEVAVVETSAVGEDLVFEDASTLDLDGDRIEQGGIERLGDITGDGHEEVGLRIQDGGAMAYTVIGTAGVEELVRFEGGEGTRPSVQRTVAPDGDEQRGSLVTHLLDPDDEESTVTVWDGSERFRLEMDWHGEVRGLRDDIFIPAALAGDVDGDGTVAIAMAAPDGSGVILVLYDIATGEQRSRLVLEPFDEGDPEDDLLPAMRVDRIPEGTADGEVALGVIADAGVDGSPTFYVVDPTEERVIASGDAEDGEFVGFGDDEVGLLGTDASLRAFDPADSVELDDPNEESTLTLSWQVPGEQGHVSTVRVNERTVAVTSDTEATIRLPDGTHDLAVTATNPAGITTHDSTTVTVDEGSLTGIVVSAVAVLSVVVLFAIGLAEDLKRRIET